jgi:hypothetical protein
MATWKDTTSYSRGDTERVPTTFTIITGELSITVTRGHIRCPGMWVMHCPSLRIDTMDMNYAADQPIEWAQERAIQIVRERLSAMLLSVISIQ